MAETNDHSINHLMSASAPYEQVGVSPLVQRSLNHLTTPVGVINTRQMHRHQTTTNALADRLLQRLSLPEQQASRYRIGVLQPGAIAPSIQRFQRREAMPASLSAEVWQADRPSLFNSSDASLEMASPVISRPLSVEPTVPAIARSVEPSSRLDRAEVAPADSGSVFRIRRRTQSVEPAVETPLSLTTSSQSAPGFSAESSTTVSMPSASTSVVQASDSTSVSSIPMTGLGAAGASAIAQRRYTLTEVVQRSALPSQPRSPQMKPTPLVHSHPVLHQSSEVTPANPTIQRRYPLAEVVQRSGSESSGEPSAIVLAQVNRSVSNLQRQADPPSTSRPSTSRMTDSMPQRYALSEVVQRSVLPSSQESSQTTVTPLLSAQPHPLPAIQRRSPSNQSEATTLPLVQPPSVTASPLPLAITAQVNPSNINRQETSPTVVAPAETINANSQATASTAQPSPAQTMNAADMVDQVSRILSRQLAVERERRGMGL